MKESVRREIRKKLTGLDPAVLHAKSMAACRRLMAQPEFKQARTIMLYLPMSREVDVTPVALRGWQDDKTLAAPKCSWGNRRMIAVQIHSMEDGIAVTRGELREPAAGDPLEVATIDLVIVPAMAFDRSGNRLGRGAGFYDRFLASGQFAGKSVGLAFHEQVVEGQLPIQQNDVPVHMLVTDEEVLRFAPGGGPACGKEAGSAK